MELMIVAFVVTLIGGSICGIVAVVQIQRLKSDVAFLRRRFEDDSHRAPRPAPPPDPITAAPTTETAETIKPAVARRDVDVSPAAAARTDTKATPQPPKWARSTEPREPTWVDAAAENLRENWMIWLGGACVMLAGIFLVRYSIERGLLGPLARVVAAIVLGLAFHGVSEWLRRKTASTHPAFSALAGAGSVTLYAALLAAVRLYELIMPGTAFFLMALVAIGTMAMALIHGPLLAAFGILGAYLVPILLSTGGGDILIALIYALIVSASAVLLLRYVYRPWLWYGFVAGAIGWWLISLGQTGADGFRTLYLTALAYLVAAVPVSDWLLQRQTTLPATNRLRELAKAIEEPERSRVLTLLLFTLAIPVTVYVNPDSTSPWLASLPFFILALRIAGQQQTLIWMPWLTLLGTLSAWLLVSFDWHDGTLFLLMDDERVPFLSYLFIYAGVAVAGSFLNLNAASRSGMWASLLSLAPMLTLTLAWLLAAPAGNSGTWAVATAAFAAAYMALATSARKRESVDSLVVWLFIGGHYGLALAAAMAFDAASLTLAIAAQIISLAWVIQSFKIQGLNWLLKLVVLVVIARLTFNPWLLDYASANHWTLWTYGGSTLFAGFAAWMLRENTPLRRWTEAAALHLFVLTVWTEARYWIYDGAVYAGEFAFAEAVSLMSLFGALSLVYFYRSKTSESLSALYRLYSTALLLLALASYGLILVRLLANDPWLYDAIGTRPIFNLASYTFIAPVIIGLLYARFYLPQYRKIALAFSAIAAFVFVTLQVRHLWTETVRLNFPPVSDGELYTYSAVWLLIAIALLLSGSWKFGRDIYRAGVALLVLVIAKLFLVDLSDLQGLLRVASFLGLGLSLLGVSYLHQKLNTGGQQQADERELTSE